MEKLGKEKLQKLFDGHLMSDEDVALRHMFAAHAMSSLVLEDRSEYDTDHLMHARVRALADRAWMIANAMLVSRYR